MLPKTDDGWSTARRLLDGRCTVPVTLVDVPRGHGRSELLRQAFAADAPESGAREILVVAGVGRLTTDVALAVEVVRRLGGTTVDRRSLRGPEDPVDVVVEALQYELTRAPQVVVAVDDAHRAGEPALAMLGHLAAVLPRNAHLVIGGTGLHRIRLAEMESEGRLQRIGPDLLMLRELQSPERRSALRREALEKDVDETVRRLLAVLVSLGIERVDRARIAAQALSLGTGSVESLSALPGVVRGLRDIEIDEGWLFAAGAAAMEDLRTAGHAVGRVLLGDGRDLGEVARLAERLGDAALFRQCVRRALSAQPPLVGAHELRSWAASPLLPPDDPHRLWVEAASAAAVGAPLDDVFDRYKRASAAFAANDVDAEIAIGMTASIIARRREDLMAVISFIDRARVLVANGCDAARAPARFGDALAKQMLGDAQGALDVLEQIAPGELSGDWAAQLYMMRGTNLLLLERLDEAVAALSASTGWGSAWSHAIALDLLAFTRWRQGDLVGALDDLQAAENLAGELGQPLAVERARCLREVMLAASGEPSAIRGVPATVSSAAAEPETTRFVPIARALSAIAAGDLDTARRIIGAVDAPERALRSTSWTAALQVALDPAARARWAAVVERHPSLGVAVRAGEAAAAYLATGRPAPLEARGFVAWAWCAQHRPVVEIDLIGGAAVRRNGVPVVHANWDRGRIRELCLCLAIAPHTARELIAARVWPDLSSSAGSKNLRVTLSHLLDVIDPDRRRGTGSELLVDQGGVLGFVNSENVRIDVQRQAADCNAVIAADAAGDRPAALAHARRLVRYAEGRLLGGATVGAWAEQFESDHRAMLVRALSIGARAAIEASDPRLALDLSRRGLSEDPWAERLHRLAVEAHLAIDDLDGARRTMFAAIRSMREMDMAPELETKRLARSLGLDPMGNAGPARRVVTRPTG